MARKKIREYDSKRLLKEHYKRLAGKELGIKSAQITESTDVNELVEKEPWLSSEKLVVKPDMLFGKRGKSGLVALNLDLAEVAVFVKERLGKEVEMGGCKGPITTFIVEPFVPHNEEFYLNIVSERLGCSISFSECGGIEIEENWDKIERRIYYNEVEDLTVEWLDNTSALMLNLSSHKRFQRRGNPNKWKAAEDVALITCPFELSLDFPGDGGNNGRSKGHTGSVSGISDAIEVEPAVFPLMVAVSVYITGL